MHLWYKAVVAFQILGVGTSLQWVVELVKADQIQVKEIFGSNYWRSKSGCRHPTFYGDEEGYLGIYCPRLLLL